MGELKKGNESKEISPGNKRRFQADVTRDHGRSLNRNNKPSKIKSRKFLKKTSYYKSQKNKKMKCNVIMKAKELAEIRVVEDIETKIKNELKITPDIQEHCVNRNNKNVISSGRMSNIKRRYETMGKIFIIFL